MTKIHVGVVHQSQTIFRPGNHNTSIEHKKLPAGTYLVGVDIMGYYCERVEDMHLPKKLYGTTIDRAARIVKTFKSRGGNTGVLLSGLKGAGKTLLSKAISILLLDDGIPTILVNQSFCGDAFAQFLSALNTEFVMLLDEFEKVYDADDQEKLLTLLDGVHQSKGLFLLTCNKQHKVDENFINRPSRVFYNIHYKGMELEAIRELALDTLQDKKRVDEITKLSSLFNDEMNFDMVQSAIEEINRYPDQKMAELMEMMNLRPNTSAMASNYTATLQVAGKTYTSEGVYPNEPRLSIFSFANLRFYVREGFSDEERDAGAGVDAKKGSGAVAAQLDPVIGFSLPDMSGLSPEKKQKKLAKIARKAKEAAETSSPADDDDEVMYDQNRAKLGADYEDIWEKWVRDFKYYNEKRNLKEFVFSNRQMKGSNLKDATYTFVADSGAVLTLKRVADPEMGASDYYNLL